MKAIASIGSGVLTGALVVAILKSEGETHTAFLCLVAFLVSGITTFIVAEAWPEK